MSAASGAKIIKDNLVFAYDMGSEQSWNGEPTTNEFVSGLLNNNYGGDGVLVNVPDAFGQNSPVYRKTGKIRFGNTGGGDEGTLYYGNTYTFSVYMRLTNNHTNTAGFELDIVDRQSTVWVDGEIVTDNIRNHMTTEWRRFSVTATHDNNSNYRFIDIGIYQSTTNEFDWCCPQIELKSYPTPYVGSWGASHVTRSNNEAIIDWAGNNTVSPLDLEYTADNKFKFNGLGERDGSPLGSYLPLPTAATTTLPSSKPNGVTYDIWLKADTDAPDRMGLFVGSGTINHIEIYSSSKSFRTEAVTQNGYSFGAGAFPDNCRGVWSNFTIVFANNETNRPVRWYQNGELFHTHANMGSGNDVNQYFLPSRLGSATGSASYLYADSFKGEISSLKIYDKTLSEDEIKANFEALRSRHDL